MRAGERENEETQTSQGGLDVVVTAPRPGQGPTLHQNHTQ